MNIRVGGVPEHFNMPWHWAIQNSFFERESINLQWMDFPGGTGAMNKALRNDEIDIALMLTEGAIADIANGNPAKVLQWYVKSPLLWGIHVAANSEITSQKQIEGKRYAISRFGSGSHLMAKVDSYQRGFHLEESRFVVVNNLDGAVEALRKGEADVFMWEKFMTKPYVDNGTFRRIGECPTPWQCFAMVARNEFYNANTDKVQILQKIINKVAGEFKHIPLCETFIASRYKLKEEDVQTWLDSVTWSNSNKIDKQEFMKIQEMLVLYGIIPHKFLFENMVVQPKDIV